MNGNTSTSLKGDSGKLFYVNWPYYWLGLDKDPKEDKEGGKWVIFFGNDFFNTPEINIDKFVETTNKCLDYVREKCKDYELIYRPHPLEEKEIKLLNLVSFTVQRDSQTAEEFMLENKGKVHHTFSICSTASIAGLNLGLNSHCFYRCFKDVFKGKYKLFVDNYLRGLPSNFFMENFEEPLLENKIKIEEDKDFKESFVEILEKNKGPVWLIVSETRYLLAILALTKMTREIFPSKKIKLVISRHHRWSDADLDKLRDKFDDVLVFPRNFYSLKPSRIFSAFRVSRKIKNMPVEEGSVLAGFTYHDFLENCLVSYHKNKFFKVAFLMEHAWKLHFKTKDLDFEPAGLSFNKAGFFYNKFFEPLLGLNRTRFTQYKDFNMVYFIRTEKELEVAYDRVYLIKNSPINH